MATVYDNGRHRKHLARLANSEVREVARVIGSKAKADLATHRDTGAAQVFVERAGVDYIVALEDAGGGAMAIEYGRAGGVDSKGRKFPPQEGKHILGRHL